MFFLVTAGLFGLLVGSFLNVVIHRVPARKSIVRPPSACPRCGRRIRPWDNVPVVSWLVLRGRCRDCGEAIAARYPLVEAAGGAVMVGVVWRLTVVDDLAWAVPAFAYVAAIGLALAVIDLDTHRLPNRIVLPAYVVTPILLAVASAGEGDWQALLRAAAGGAILYGLYLALLLARPGGMGFGDVKLAGVLGMALGWLGWGPFVVGAFAAFLIGGVAAVVLMLAGSAGLKTRIPFGPWMVLGAYAGAACGEQAWTAYLGTFG